MCNHGLLMFSVDIVVNKKKPQPFCCIIQKINGNIDSIDLYHLKNIFVYYYKCKGNSLLLNGFITTWINVYRAESQHVKTVTLHMYVDVFE